MTCSWRPPFPNAGRLLHHPQFEPLYYAEYRRLMAGAFATNNLFPLMDQVLAIGRRRHDPSHARDALARINDAASVLPPAPAVVQATVAGEPISPTYS